MQTVFRRLRSGEASLLRNVDEDVFDNAIEPMRAEHFLRDERNILIVAMVGNSVVGQIAAMIHEHIDALPDLYIDNLGVTPDWRRQGIATRLIAMAVEIGRSYGGEGAWVAVDADNEIAHRLYARTGAVGERIMMFSYGDSD